MTTSPTFPLAFTQMKKISLTRGKITRVNDEDFDELNQHKWYVSTKGYACRSLGRENIKMHREILGLKSGDLDVDHRDRDRLNNRRSNLRQCTNAQNARNRGLHARNRTGFMGVYWDPKTSKFRSCILVSGKTVNLGYFDTAEEASKVRDASAVKYWGEFASTTP